MSESIPLKYLKIAKQGSFYEVISALRYLIQNDEKCDFKAKRDGAFYVGLIDKGFETILVAPDNRLDFTELKNFTLYQACDFLETSCSSNPILGWEEFIVWLNKQLVTKINSINQINGLSINSDTVLTNISQYPFPETISGFFNWLKTNLYSNGVTSKYRLEDFISSTVAEQEFLIPITFYTSNTDLPEITLHLILCQ